MCRMLDLICRIKDFASFQVQTAGWMGNGPPNVQQATAFATGDPAVYSLEGLDFRSLLENPLGEIELSLGPQQVPYQMERQSAAYAQFAHLFGSYDYSQTNVASPQQVTSNGNGSTVPSRVMSPVEAPPPPAFFSNDIVPQQQSLIPSEPPSPFFVDNIQGSRASSSAPSPSVFHHPHQQQHVVPSFGQEFQQYFNFDAQSDMGSLDHSSISPRSTSGHSHSIPGLEHNVHGTSPTHHAPYVPPLGAAHVGSRRVAGSWKPPQPEADSQNEHSPSGTWPYVSARS